MNAYRVAWATVCYWGSTVEAESLEDAKRIVDGLGTTEDEQRREGDFRDRADLYDEFDYLPTEITLDEEETAKLKVETPPAK